MEGYSERSPSYSIPFRLFTAENNLHILAILILQDEERVPTQEWGCWRQRAFSSFPNKRKRRRRRGCHRSVGRRCVLLLQPGDKDTVIYVTGEVSAGGGGVGVGRWYPPAKGGPHENKSSSCRLQLIMTTTTDRHCSHDEQKK